VESWRAVGPFGVAGGVPCDPRGLQGSWEGAGLGVVQEAHGTEFSSLWSED
jgi:hypothetical protein